MWWEVRGLRPKTWTGKGCTFSQQSSIKSNLRKHPFLLALRCWGRFARRNVCDSTTEIPYWWCKICPKSGQKRLLVDGVVTLFQLLFTNDSLDRQKTKGHRGQMLMWRISNKNSQYLLNIVFSRRSIWILLELFGRWTQHFTKIYQKTHKIGQSYIWNPMTTGFFM